jgi:hypothetical protein
VFYHLFFANFASLHLCGKVKKINSDQMLNGATPLKFNQGYIAGNQRKIYEIGKNTFKRKSN